MTIDSRAIVALLALVLASSCLANLTLAAPQAPTQASPEETPATSLGANIGQATSVQPQQQDKPALSNEVGADKSVVDGVSTSTSTPVAGARQAPEFKPEEQKEDNNESDGLTEVALEPRKPSEVSKPPFDLKKFFNFNEWVKLIFNPFELVRRICEYFKLPFGKTIDKLGTSMVRGLEPLLYPLVFSAKIVEKLFQPDQCRLKFVCHIGRHLNFVRENVLKFSPNFLEGSSHLKALSEGIVGRDCSAIFPECEPKLKKQFAELKDQGSVNKPIGDLFPLGAGARGLTIEPVGVEQKAATILVESKP